MRLVNTKKPDVSAPAQKSRVGGIESHIQAVGDITEYFNALFYGRSGTGKTTILGSAPKPLLVLDIKEKGVKSIRRQEGAFVVPIETWSDFEEIYWYLKRNPEAYKTVGIDTTSMLQKLAVLEVTKGKGAISQRGWGNIATLMQTWIVNFRDLPMHTIFTAQERISRGNDENELEEVDSEESDMILPEIGPAVIPSVAGALNAAVDIIGQTFIRDHIIPAKKEGGKARHLTEYCLRIGPHAQYVTKFRRDQSGLDVVDLTPKVLANPTFDQLYQLSIGE